MMKNMFHQKKKSWERSTTKKTVSSEDETGSVISFHILLWWWGMHVCGGRGILQIYVEICVMCNVWYIRAYIQFLLWDFKKVVDSELRINTAKNGHNSYNKSSDRLNTVKGKIEQFWIGRAFRSNPAWFTLCKCMCFMVNKNVNFGYPQLSFEVHCLVPKKEWQNIHAHPKQN